jgi:hypothetical protein
MNWKNALKIFTKEKIVYKYKESDRSLEVLEIDPDADTIHASLGIVNDRIQRLVDYCKQETERMAKENEGAYNAATVMANVSKLCKHPNELAMVCFILGHKVGKESENPIAAMFEHFRKMGEGPQ